MANWKEFVTGKKENIKVISLLLFSFFFGFVLAQLRLPKTLTQSYNTPNMEYKQQNTLGNVQNNTTPKPKKKTKIDPNCLIKGKTNKEGIKKYYVPGTLSYSRVKQEVCFKSEEEAVKQGYVKSR